MFNKDYIWEWINTEGRTSHMGSFFVPSRDHLSTCFASFPVATVQGIPGHGSKHVFYLGGIRNKKPICFTDFNGVCRRSSNLFIHIFDPKWFAECQPNLGHPQERSCRDVGLDHYVSPSVSPGEFLEASEDKNWEQRILPGHVKWWHDTKQMFGLMQDVSVWDGIPNRIFPCYLLQDFDRYCPVMSSSNIAKYYLLE